MSQFYVPVKFITSSTSVPYWTSVAYPGILFVGVQQIQLRTEDRENMDLGAVAP